MAFLFKLVAKRNNGKLEKGMIVEIYKQNSSSLSQKEVAQALNNKYNSNIHESHCGLGNFEIEKMNR